MAPEGTDMDGIEQRLSAIETRLHTIETRLSLLTWMAAINLTLTVAALAKLLTLH